MSFSSIFLQFLWVKRSLFANRDVQKDNGLSDSSACSGLTSVFVSSFCCFSNMLEKMKRENGKWIVSMMKIVIFRDSLDGSSEAARFE
jgi:hypothetical protein